MKPNLTGSVYFRLHPQRLVLTESVSLQSRDIASGLMCTGTLSHQSFLLDGWCVCGGGGELEKGVIRIK